MEKILNFALDKSIIILEFVTAHFIELFFLALGIVLGFSLGIFFWKWFLGE